MKAKPPESNIELTDFYDDDYDLDNDEEEDDDTPNELYDDDSGNDSKWRILVW